MGELIAEAVIGLTLAQCGACYIYLHLGNPQQSIPMGPDGPEIITDPGFAEVTYVGGARTIQGFNLALPTDRDRVHRIAVAKRTWLRPLVYQQHPCANCHAAFARLPRGRSLRSVWEDPAVRIGYVTSIHARGLTSNATGIIALTLAGLALSPRNIAATLLHELAHVNGADDAPSSTAEQMLRYCGFNDLFTPGI